MLRMILFFITLGWSVFSFSAIQILATRVILNEAEKEQSFTIRNTGDMPSLVQIWLAEKSNSSMAITNDIPLVITPPVARINANRSKVFRFFPTEEAATALAKDRESMFWINALDVPAIDDNAESGNKLDIAFRTRIKAFYRPAGLSGTLIEAAENLKWTVKKEKAKWTYTVTNDSPYHISFSRFTLLGDGDKELETLPGEMIDPYSSKKIVFNRVSNNVVEMNYQYITDLGAFVFKKLTL
ncbi:molecular chaperone [Erwinia sp.]|uniref:fimbrial biogenesis chaperone n=1 Tax=Erwinia citreus TaxID=558 RepID=UPI002898A111|nr:molecular chaperone [Erwinia sp.]